MTRHKKGIKDTRDSQSRKQFKFDDVIMWRVHQLLACARWLLSATWLLDNPSSSFLLRFNDLKIFLHWSNFMNVGLWFLSITLYLFFSILTWATIKNNAAQMIERNTLGNLCKCSQEAIRIVFPLAVFYANLPNERISIFHDRNHDLILILKLFDDYFVTRSLLLW